MDGPTVRVKAKTCTSSIVNFKDRIKGQNLREEILSDADLKVLLMLPVVVVVDLPAAVHTLLRVPGAQGKV